MKAVYTWSAILAIVFASEVGDVLGRVTGCAARSC